MNPALAILIGIAQFIGLIAVSAVIGLWWTPAFDHGNRNAEIMRATFFLLLFSAYFYKAVIKQKNYLPKILFIFYSALAICAVCAYVFGFFTK